ncbi:MAG: vWA domain-containing protein, partial [Planctomycetota bacterium]
MLLSVLVVAVASSSASGAEIGPASRGTGEPCYVVIAVDVSGSMERADAPRGDARRRRWTLRDEGQLALMQLLPFVYSDLHVGVCHFSDKVRYALPSEETGPLLAWGGSYLSEAACRNMVRPAEFVGSYQTDIAESMDWALARIRAARRRHGDGPGKVLLLSHGDPRDSSRELAGEGPLLAAGARLAEQDIRVYPIIVNEASSRPGTASRRLSSSARTAESVMLSLASISGGRAYRLTPEMGFPDILMDVFELGTPLTGALGISPYDWAVVMVGRRPDSVSVVSVGQGGGSEAVSWGAGSEVDPSSGVRSREVPSTQWPVTILRRPDGEGAVDQFWKGTWTPLAADGQREMGVRMYRVPDFVVKLEAAPAFPWWVHQEGQVTARLLDRHAGRRAAQQVDGSGRADGLSVRLTARGKDQGQVLRIDDGQWTAPGRSYATGSFTLGSSGLYDVTCDLLYALGDVNVPLIGLTEEVQVYRACVGVDILSADDVGLGELPEASGSVSLDAEGGKDVYFRVTPRGSFNARPGAGVLHLTPLEQGEWVLRKDANNDLSTGLVRLPEDEDHLTAWAQLEVGTPAGLRQFRLPDYELVYRPAPLRIECTFGEPRRVLWVGEFHRQLLTISAFPIFEASRHRTEAMFPETLSAPRMRTVDLQSGTAQVTGPRGRLIEVPKPTGAKGRTVAATYALEAGVPIAPADQCEISVDGAIPDLVGGVKTYTVIDPVAAGLFRWTVRQEPVPARSERVSEVLYRGEPVRFSAQWQADQNVSAVRFEIPRPEREEPFSVDLPIAAAAGQASVEPMLPQLERGETYAVHVYVTMQPSVAAPAVEVKLRG